MKEPLWVEEREALCIQDRLLAFDGGAAGLRDRALLESALARPRQLQAYAEFADIIDMAAAYTSGMVRNHPFIDGNKRTGFVVGVLFLEINGYLFTAPEEDATQAVLGLASGAIEEPSFAAWLRTNARPAPQT